MPSVALVLSILSVGLLIYYILLLRAFMTGSTGKNLETTLLSAHAHIKELTTRTTLLEATAHTTDSLLTHSPRLLSTLKFDAFAGPGGASMSGKQSFATALVSPKGDGIVIVGLLGRDNQRVYIKQIKEWKAEIQLTPEEQEALDKARALL